MRWDIFCKVIDNYGDIGVCWRLACNLAALGQQVRLWVDDASALAWMAPGGCAGVETRVWAEPFNMAGVTPADVLVEAFGCEIAPEYIAAYAISARANANFDHPKRPWINLEYLSAEPYAQRNHGLPSPVLSGPGAGLTKHFFYPGFTSATGGLLREPDLALRQASFNKAAWLAGLAQRCAQGGPDQPDATVKPTQANPPHLNISLFCYEPAALRDLLAQLAGLEREPRPARLLITHGRAAAAVKTAIQAGDQAGLTGQIGLPPSQNKHSQLSFLYLPPLSQPGYDKLLWASDLNFVRGEDSLVRALWAGQPFIWHIYPQDDGAHAAKLEAFLDWLGADAALRRFHRVWNGLDSGTLPPLDLPAWGRIALTARQKLLDQTDLATQLLNFVVPEPGKLAKNR